MRYPNLAALLAARSVDLAKGPLAVVMAEDEVEVNSTLAHQQKIGFRDVVLLAPDGIEIAAELEPTVHVVAHDVHAPSSLTEAVNQMIPRLHGTWIHYCYNAEYLFYPFIETRRVRELLTFHTEERREAMMTYVVDLYAGDLAAHPNAVSHQDAWFDKSGYYALARKDPAKNWEPKDRQLDFFGGLRWRFEEHVAWDRRKIDRVSLFRAKPGLRVMPDYTLSDEEMNTYACTWHNNLTAAVCSFRAAKALTSNPGSREAIKTFRWQNSARFDWHSQQLLGLGIIEPGQWF